jgi:hypothetical protein
MNIKVIITFITFSGFFVHDSIAKTLWNQTALCLFLNNLFHGLCYLQQFGKFARSEVLTAVLMKIPVFWGVTPCILVYSNTDACITIYMLPYPRKLISWGESSPDVLKLYYDEHICVMYVFKYI